MFAKTAKFRVARVLQAAPRFVTLAHSNDNTMAVRAAGEQRRTRRPKLACHWRLATGGGLECHWDMEPDDGAATEEPDQRWISIYDHPFLSRRACGAG